MFVEKRENVIVRDNTKYGKFGEPAIILEIVPIQVLANIIPISPIVKSILRRVNRLTNVKPNKVPITEIIPLPILPISAASEKLQIL